MNREEIMKMELTELSLAVADKIFQAKICDSEKYPGAKLLIGCFGEKAWKPLKGEWRTAEWKQSEESAWLDCPKYAEDISAAWEVVERFQESHLYTDIRTCADFYEVWITDHANDKKTETFASPKLPEAICKAALLAMEESHEQ